MTPARNGSAALRVAVAVLVTVSTVVAGVWIGVTSMRSATPASRSDLPPDPATGAASGATSARATAADSTPGAGTGDDGATESATPVLPVLPVPGQTGAATCVDPAGRREWRVRWRADQVVPGTMITATALESRSVAAAGPAAVGPTAPSAWQDRSGEAWALRWTLPPQDASGPERRSAEQRGPLSILSTVPVEAAHSPRFVSPDGACSVFVTPFGNGAPDWPAVAVLGDSLVAQLRQRKDDDRWRTGLMQRRLLELSRRVEVTGQGGRRFVSPPKSGTGVDLADAVLTDEIRGLRGVRAQVVALGTNDAGWVSLAPDTAQYELRLAWVLTGLKTLLDEIRDSDQCTVLVTAGDRQESYLGSPQERYARAASAINDELRRRAAEDPDDGVRLWDWAERSAPHHTGDRVPWFGPDTIHLNDAGREVYARELARAAQLC